MRVLLCLAVALITGVTLAAAAPALRDTLFRVGPDAQALQQDDREASDSLNALIQAGATPEQVEQYAAFQTAHRNQRQAQLIEAHRQSLDRLRGWAAGLIWLLAAVTVAESVTEGALGGGVWRRVRVGLMMAWVFIMAANPVLLRHTPWGLIGTVLFVGALAWGASLLSGNRGRGTQGGGTGGGGTGGGGSDTLPR